MASSSRLLLLLRKSSSCVNRRLFSARREGLLALRLSSSSSSSKSNSQWHCTSAGDLWLLAAAAAGVVVSQNQVLFAESPQRYDMTRLMIGSEGTLGVITEVTLKLQKLPEASVVAVCSFPSIKDAADVAIATMHSGIQVSRVEMLDEAMVKILNAANSTEFKEAPMLMFEFIGTDAYALEQTLRVEKIVAEHYGSGFTYFDTPEEKERLWRMRKEALWACFAVAPDAEAMSTDVCVPLSRLADCIAKSKIVLDASPLMCPIVSHAGDGNFHTIILFDPLNEAQLKEAERLNDFMVHTALSMEGTCTGEHGVGTGKMKYMEKELGYDTLKAMKKLKHALDPNNIMNPGKMIPSHVCL